MVGCTCFGSARVGLSYDPQAQIDMGLNVPERDFLPYLFSFLKVRVRYA